MSKRKTEKRDLPDKRTIASLSVAGAFFIAFLLIALAIELLALEFSALQLIATAGVFLLLGWGLKNYSEK